MITRHSNSSIGVLGSTGVNSERYLNILDIILRNGEYTVIHIGSLSTATEVHDLEGLVHLGSTLSLDGAATVYVAVCIESTAVIQGDRAFIRHIEKACCTRSRSTVKSRTLDGIMLCGNADRTVYSDLNTFCKSKLAVDLHAFLIFQVITTIDSLSLCGIHRIIGVEGDEESLAGSNSIIACRHCTAVHTGDRITLACICRSYRLIQAIVKIRNIRLIICKLA